MNQGQYYLMHDTQDEILNKYRKAKRERETKTERERDRERERENNKHKVRSRCSWIHAS
jgi:predicted DNA repair protein MutK